MPSITKEYYHNIDLAANELLNSRLHNITTAARVILGSTLTTSDAGYQVYDTDLTVPYYWDGSAWQLASLVTPAALTKTDDTNITLTLGGTPGTALLQNVSLTLGWTGTLDDSRITNSANWNTAYNNRITTLTTTGSSGSATLISNVLNIPTYTLSGLGGQPQLNGTGFVKASGTTISYDNSTYEPSILSGTTSQYWRGDKSWQTLDKNAVGLGNVENTALSTWAGSTNLTTLGTITTGVWHGSAIGDSYISSASTWNAKQNALSGSGIVKSTSGTISYISGTSSQFIKGDGSLDSNTYLTTAVTSVGAGTGMNFTTITGIGNVAIDTTKVPYYSSGFSAGLAKWNGSAWTWDTNNYLTSAVTSVGLSMPSAFTVTNSPVTGIGTLTVAGAGSPSQYIKGDGTLGIFPTIGGGGGGSVYYLNGNVPQGNIGGTTMYQLSKLPHTGAAANFTRNTVGTIASFITDIGDPNQLSIPAGIWVFECYLSESGGGSNHAQISAIVEKWDGNTISTISTGPIEEITNGNIKDLYQFAVTIPAGVTLSTSDRIVIQVQVSNPNGKTVTLYTEDSNLSSVTTTFANGISSINGLTAAAQTLAVGTSNTDFTISSSGSIHTFNLPVASDTNTGKLSNTDYTTFNNKASKGFAVAMAAAL